MNFVELMFALFGHFCVSRISGDIILQRFEKILFAAEHISGHRQSIRRRKTDKTSVSVALR